MAALVGVDEVTALSRRHILPTIVDQIYASNALFWRLNGANKRAISGGYHIEVPFMYQEFSNGGPYQGYDLLDVAPNDTVKNGKFDIRQHYVPVTIDGLTLAKFNTAEAAVSILNMKWEQARMQMASNLGTGIYSDTTTNTKEIDGLKGAVDAGSVATSYAGLVRSSNTWLNSQVDSSTATLTLSALRSMVGNLTIGGHTPSIILSRVEQYNRFWALGISNQRYQASDSTLLQAGFANLTFDNIPWVLDSKVFDGPNTSNSAILFLNEDTISLFSIANTDFYMEDFAKPVNQDAMVGMLKWYGNLMVLAPQLSGKMTAVAA